MCSLISHFTDLTSRQEARLRRAVNEESSYLLLEYDQYEDTGVLNVRRPYCATLHGEALRLWVYNGEGDPPKVVDFLPEGFDDKSWLRCEGRNCFNYFPHIVWPGAADTKALVEAYCRLEMGQPFYYNARVGERRDQLNAQAKLNEQEIVELKLVSILAEVSVGMSFETAWQQVSATKYLTPSKKAFEELVELFKRFVIAWEAVPRD